MVQIISVNKNNNDAELIMKWRNDINTRKNSFNQNEYKWDEFKKIFYEKYFNNQLPPLFALYENNKIAFIGSMNTIEKDTIEISINIDPNYRNKKLSIPIINEVLKYIQKNNPFINNIRAEIKSFNISSIKCFEKSGFFNENYDVCFEDVQLNATTLLLGLENYCDGNSVAYHYESQTREKDEETKNLETNDFLKKLLPFLIKNFNKLINKTEIYKF